MEHPAFNNIKNNLITRDSLGIESTVSSIAGDICPIVTTVTPRAFYWAFLTWLYNDYCVLNQFKERSLKEFSQFLRRNDYYFVLAVLLTSKDTSNLAGITKAQSNIKSGLETFPFDDTYFKASLGGMQYYNGGCRTMQFIVEQDETGKPYAFPKLSTKGKKLAEAFSGVISKTEFYQKYRNSNEPVPKTVLIEYGTVINLGLDGFDECKEILRESLFKNKNNSATRDSARYLKFLYENEGIQTLDLSKTRQIFYDYYSPRGEKRDYPDTLKNVIIQWEMETGRRYFVIGLEMIWKFMMEKLSMPLSMEEWISRSVYESSWNSDINTDLNSYSGKCVFTFPEREKIIDKARRNGTDHSDSVENGLKLILSVAERFKNRADIVDEERFLHYGNGCVSVWEMMKCVDEFESRPTVFF